MNYPSLSLRLFLTFLLALSGPACGDDDSGRRTPDGGVDAGTGGDAGSGGTDGGGDDAGGCSPLELREQTLFYSTYDELLGVSYALSEPLGDPTLPDFVLIELYDSTTATADGFLATARER